MRSRKHLRKLIKRINNQSYEQKLHNEIVQCFNNFFEEMKPFGIYEIKRNNHEKEIKTDT